MEQGILNISDLKIGDLILFRSQSFLAKAIRWIAQIKYNHVGVAVENWDAWVVNEAIGRGVLPSPIENRLQGKTICIRRTKLYSPTNDIEKKALAIKFNSILGVTKYDFIALLVYQLVYQLTKQLGFNKGKGYWIGRKGKDAEKRMYCYEYAAWGYPQIFSEPWQVDPIEFMNDENFITIFEGKVEQITNNK